jgi:methylmalonyl-CoA mutase cobalamin-binding subunit
MGAQRVLVVVAEAGGTSRVARVWRDEGHEVVLVGPGTVAAEVAAAAVQEDVDLVVLVAGAEDRAEGRGTEDVVAEVRRLLASYGADDVEVVTASDPRPDLP